MTLPVLEHPFPTPPEPGAVAEVAPGILWLRMRLPFALDHINLWALDGGPSAPSTGWTLVDTGVGGDETRAAWETLFAGPLAGKPVTRVVCTHFHPDHMGMAGWLGERWGVSPTATIREWAFARLLWRDFERDYLDHQAEHYRRAGYTPGMVEGVRARGNTYRPRITAPPLDHIRIKDGDRLDIGGRVWHVIEGGGHSPEHACLHCPEAGVLISGDQILPRISPIVGVWHQEPEAEPLELFLGALGRLAELPAGTLVLPSHGLPFLGLHARVEQLRQHHRERLDKTLAACALPRTAFDLVGELFRPGLDEYQTSFATGETLAHLHHLMREGLIERVERADGVRLYRRTGL